MKDHRQPVDSIYKDIIRMNHILIGICIVLAGLLFLSILKSDKPPLVIRYDYDGTAKVSDSYASDSRVNRFDVSNFLNAFVKNWNLQDSFSIQETLPEAIKMMSPDLKSETLKKLSKSFISNLESKKQKTKTSIQKITFKKAGKEYIEAQIRYKRHIISFNNKPVNTLDIKIDPLIIRLLPERSKRYPYGLMIEKFEDYQLN